MYLTTLRYLKRNSKFISLNYDSAILVTLHDLSIHSHSFFFYHPVISKLQPTLLSPHHESLMASIQLFSPYHFPLPCLFLCPAASAHSQAVICGCMSGKSIAILLHPLLYFCMFSLFPHIIFPHSYPSFLAYMPDS